MDNAVPSRTSTERDCWCGSHDLHPFSEDYRVCGRCGSLVSRVIHERDVSRVTSDGADLYGKDYWFGHMEKDLGFANIFERARTDLSERCLHWLNTLLTYRLPPGNVLELGSAHGGFVALLRWAGFDASGLELSPAIAQIARETFGVPMLQGPIEDQQIDPGSLDVIVLMDVLEHLPDPVATMRHCVSLLKPDGFLLIQTPAYPEGQSIEALRTSGHRFVEQLKEDEHLYLFTQRSVAQLMAEIGLHHLSFEPAIFSHYDMFFTASRTALAAIDPADADAGLTRTAGGRLVTALRDLDARLRDSIPRSVFDVCEADRAARLEVIERLGSEVGTARHAAAAAQARADALQVAFDAAEADRAARLEVIRQQGARLAEAEARLDEVERLAARRIPD